MIARLHAPLAERIAEVASGSGPGFLVGVTGSQGSGKTTTARALARLLDARGLRAAILSLDDLYLPLADRRRLAAEVHPLFLTRGVPGTHDVDLGVAILEGLAAPGATLMPRFDKATDDRASAWDVHEGPFDVILFEGWCVGARPQAPGALIQPVNDLERERVVAVIVDGAQPGSGVANDWASVKTLDFGVPMIVAGGLDAHNVAAVIDDVNPWGVDVASGVEVSHGVKDPAKVASFVARARAALTQKGAQ